MYLDIAISWGDCQASTPRSRSANEGDRPSRHPDAKLFARILPADGDGVQRDSPPPCGYRESAVPAHIAHRDPPGHALGDQASLFCRGTTVAAGGYCESWWSPAASRNSWLAIGVVAETPGVAVDMAHGRPPDLIIADPASSSTAGTGHGREQIGELQRRNLTHPRRPASSPGRRSPGKAAAAAFGRGGDPARRRAGAGPEADDASQTCTPAAAERPVSHPGQRALGRVRGGRGAWQQPGTVQRGGRDLCRVPAHAAAGTPRSDLAFLAPAGRIYSGGDPPFTERHRPTDLPLTDARNWQPRNPSEFADRNGQPTVIGRIAICTVPARTVETQDSSRSCAGRSCAPAHIDLRLARQDPELSLLSHCAEMVVGSLALARAHTGTATARNPHLSARVTIGASSQCRRGFGRPVSVVSGTSPLAKFQSSNLSLRR